MREGVRCPNCRRERLVAFSCNGRFCPSCCLGLCDGQTGAVTFIQRFGGALDLNPHFHAVLPDGL
jgi:hypothetical protein